QGIPNFMEVNPLAGLHPEHSDLPIICNLAGITYHNLIDMIMRSALKRLHLHPPVSRAVKSSVRRHTLTAAFSESSC
ncbi:MAG TPA: hypothetical protein VEF33_06160, partial [Syntrophales bacterium]|nr:hypothetical protein [Syntrophales bacterium]